MTSTINPHHDLEAASEPDRGRRRRSSLLAPAALIAVAGLVVLWSLRSRGDTSPAEDGAGAAVELAELRFATEADPTSAAAWIEFGRATLDAAVSSGDRDEYLAAKDAFDRAVALAPHSVDAVAARAGFALNAHDFATALQLAERAVTLDPLHPTALAALVDARIETGRYEEAEQALGVLLKSEPGVAAYARVAYLRELRGDVRGAETAMQQAIATAGPGPDRADLFGFLGTLQLSSGNVDAAARSFDRALRDDSGNAAATVGQAQVLVARGGLAEAAAVLERANTLGPETLAPMVRGELARLSGDEAAAIAAFTEVRRKDDRLRARGENTDLDMVWYLADHGDPAEALRKALEASQVRSTVFAADAIAWSYFRSGDVNAAREFVDTALSLGTRTPAVRVHAAAILAAVGERDRAREELVVAFEGAPWISLSIQPIAAQLAADLSVDVPPAWRGAVVG